MAISRYRNFDQNLDLKLLKRRLETFPSISASDLEDTTDIIIRFQDGQRLDKIASDYLGDGRYWWAICLLNDISLPFGSQVAPGTLLRIPINISRIFNKIEQRIKKI